VKAGLRTGVGRGTIDHKQLRGFNAESGRRAVLEYLKTNCNVSETARMFGITRACLALHLCNVLKLSQLDLSRLKSLSEANTNEKRTGGRVS
jgi:hypothetical protein